MHFYYLYVYALMTVSTSQKIVSVTTSIKSTGRHEVFVQVTDGKHVGWGQCSYDNENGDLASTVAGKVHDWVTPLVIGRDFINVSELDTLSEGVWRLNYKHTGTVLAMALAGVDTALWDLLAQRRNMSVCSLVAESLGSTCQSKMPVYGSNGDRKKSPKDIVANAVANRDKYGVKAFKFQIANRMGADVDIKPGRTEELIPLARKELGAEVELMVDANGGYDDYEHALATAKLLVENNFTWFEEPFPYWEYDKVMQLSRDVPQIGFAIGEQEFRLDVFERNIHAMRYAQPDVHYVGGLSRSLRVAKMTMKANTTFVPHSPNPSMLDVFALHMLAAVPNAFGFMEFDAINTRSPPSGSDWFVESAYKLEKGAMTVPTGRGWGVTLKPGLLTKAHNQTTSTDLLI